MKKIKPPMGVGTKFVVFSAIVMLVLIAYNSLEIFDDTSDPELSNGLPDSTGTHSGDVRAVLNKLRDTAETNTDPEQPRAGASSQSSGGTLGVRGGWSDVVVPAGWSESIASTRERLYENRSQTTICQIVKSTMSETGLSTQTWFDDYELSLRESQAMAAEMAVEMMGAGTLPRGSITVSVDMEFDERPSDGLWRIGAQSNTYFSGVSLGKKAHGLMVRGDDRLDVTCGSGGTGSSIQLGFVRAIRWKPAGSTAGAAQ